jgi:hypothetical protein
MDPLFPVAGRELWLYTYHMAAGKAKVHLKLEFNWIMVLATT